MAFLLPKLPSSYPSPPLPTSSKPSQIPAYPSPPSPLTKLEPPTSRLSTRGGAASAGNLTAPPHPIHLQSPRKKSNKDDFYLNLGAAVRTLRDDLPSLFSRDLNYDIYRDDITFIDPLNTFRGIDNYKLIFWALRFHGRILFREIGVKIFRVWQPCETTILIRWELQGVPRVPWEARGRFQGTSRYKVDRNGKIYEHKVDNLAFNFPRAVRPSTVLDLVAAACPPATPNMTFRWDLMEQDAGSSAWLELYRAVRRTLDEGEGRELVGIGAGGMVTCS